ncbi:MAG TPA: type II toxin-antitoxin system death-on-curing family toxin [Methylomirabilota bacterium]|nr:type II toxin-antitoxin system death-on-curing family toxin [Methylomirabilota bacterium]
MTEPLWIAADEALAINRMLVAQFGGLDAGVRDENLFQAALGRPLNKWHYDEPKPDHFALAAAYAFGLAKGHVFHDGNKRAAYVVAVTFLAVNGVVCSPAQADIVDAMVALADGSLSEDGIAARFRKNASRPTGLAEAAAAPLRKPSPRPKRSRTRARTSAA